MNSEQTPKRRVTKECLNAGCFISQGRARRKIKIWRQNHNQQRPHSSLVYLPPAQFAHLRAHLIRAESKNAGNSQWHPYRERGASPGLPRKQNL